MDGAVSESNGGAVRARVPWGMILGVFVLTRLVLVLATFVDWPLDRCMSYEVPDATGVLRTQTIPWQPGENGELYYVPAAPRLDPFVRMDASFYLTIAFLGYNPTPTGVPPQEAGFYPGYPVACRAVATVVALVLGNGTNVLALAQPDLLLIAVLVSNATLLFAAGALWRLANSVLDATSAKRAVIAMLVWPTAFFGSVCLSESMFLWLSIEALNLALQRRGVLAGLVGALAAFTRPVGFLLALPLALAAVRRGEPRGRIVRGVASSGLVLLGPLAVAVWHQITLGNPRAWLDVQAGYGHGSFPSLAGLAHIFRLGGPTQLDVIRDAVQIGALVLAFVGFIGLLVPKAGRRIPRMLAVAALALIAIGALSNHVISLPRYLFATAPLFVGTARFLPGGKVGWVLAAAGLAAQVAGFVVFMRAWPVLI